MNIELEQEDFFQFIITKKENLIYIISAFILTTLIWTIFKHFYPNPNIIFDSYYYMNASVSKADVNAWPIGYSWFIRFIGQFSHSATFLVTVQYFLLNFLLFFYFFTIRYLIKTPFWISIFLFSFFIFNPIFVFTSNLVLSDTIFTALSILWLTNILWIFKKPKYWMIISQALVLVATLSVRYNALYYPLITTFAILLLKRNALFKISAIVMQFSLIGVFIAFTILKMESTFGVKQFSPFGGWKIANDALYMYKHVYKYNTSNVPSKLLHLDLHVHKYFDTNNDTIDLFTPDPTSGSYYMYIHPSPLLTYRDLLYGLDNSSLNLRTFSKMGPLYQDYGTWLIWNNPMAFSKYFIWPNIQRYFVSPPEVYIDNYNPFLIRSDTLGGATRNWFKIKSISSKQSSINFRYIIFMNYPIMSIIIHFVFLFSYFLLFFNKILRKLEPPILYAVIIIGAIWMFDFIFNMLAAAVVLRYQIFISIVEFSFSLFFLNEILNGNPINESK